MLARVVRPLPGLERSTAGFGSTELAAARPRPSGGWLQRVLDLVGLVGTEQHALSDAAIALRVDRDLVFTRWKAQALEDPVEIVDVAGEISVHVDLRLLRVHLDSKIR